jgi:hypothetical protein
LNKSAEIKSIALALHKAQGKIKAALKDSTNPHFRSKYADLSSVVEAVKAPLHSEGIVFLQGIEDAENGVAVETMLLHVSGEWISSTLKIPATKQDAQGYGSAITYGRRYGLQSMCGVPAEDDDGNAATASAPKPLSVAGQEWENMSEEEKKFLQELADKVKESIRKDGGLVAMKFLEEQNLQTEEKVAIWSRFDSKERAAMEPHKRPKKAA